MSEAIITNARIVAADEVFAGTIVVQDGMIARIDQGISMVASAIDIGGDYLFPGLIDIHTDNLEKHLSPRPGVRWNPIAAAVNHDAQIIGGGITTVLDSLRAGSADNAERRALLPVMLEGMDAARSRGLLRSDHLLHLRCDLMDSDLMPLLETHIDNPHLRFVTMSDNSAARNVDRYRQKLREKPGRSEEQVEDLLQEALDTNPGLTLANRRQVIELAGARGLPAASHDDFDVWHIEEAQDLGLGIAEFPLTLAAAEAAHAAGMVVVAGSPNLVRGFSHVGSVSVADMARRRILGIISSDYVPGSLLQGVFALTGETIGYSLNEAVASATRIPAEVVGLTDRGTIALGKRADLIRVAVCDDMFAVRTAWRAGERVH